MFISIAWIHPAELMAQVNQPVQEDLTVLDDWQVYQAGENSLYRVLEKEAQALLAKRRQTISQLHTENDWLAYKDGLKSTLDKIVGPFPERTPLNPIITGVVEKENYRVEKIIYESRPEFYVTAALFIPNNLTAQAPGILFCSGHTEDGFRSDTYQRMILNLVHKGFVVLAFDPFGQGERQDYLADQLRPDDGSFVLGGATKQHSYAGAQLFMLGQSLANYMIWDGIRSIDYLVSRPEVDSQRIGVTGRSGGGTQTAYIAAFDERVAAAAPEAYITSFERLLMSRGPQDAEQNLYHGIRAGINHGDLLSVRAPLPALMITTTRDFFSIQGARETFAEVKKAYKALGAEDALQMVEDDAGHASTQRNREAMYHFFMNTFHVKGNANDTNFPLLGDEELQVTQTGQVVSSFNGATVFSLLAKDAAKTNMLNGSLEQTEDYYEKVKQSARAYSGYQAVTDPVASVFAGQYQREGYRVEKHFLEGSGDYVLPFLVLLPDKEGPHPVLIALHPKGKRFGTEAQGVYESYVDMGFAVVAMDILGTGELVGGDLQGDAYIQQTDLNTWFASILVDKSIVGIQSSDLSRLVSYINERDDFDAQKIAGVAYEKLGTVLLHAAVFDNAIQGIALVEPLATTRSLVLNKYYSPKYMPYTVVGALDQYDLPDLEMILAPRSLLILNPVDQNGEILDRKDSSRLFKFVEKAYRTRNHLERLSIEQSDTPEKLASWLSKLFE
ncbi:MAG: alpha/beta hydrolase family protein [Rhodothermales bacterium]